MTSIQELREELKRRKEAQPVAEDGKITLKHVVLSSLTLVAIATIVAVSIL